MAWNEPPGDDKNKRPKDPWGNNNKNNQGPPDLEEAISQFINKINSFFNKGAGGSGSGSMLPTFGLLAAALLLVYGLWGFTKVNEGERGVIQLFGKYTKTINPGPTFIFKPFERLTKVNIEDVNKVNNDGGPSGNKEMLTQDENIVVVKYELQFRISNAENFVFKVRQPIQTLSQSAESALREVVGKSTLEYITTEGRDALAAEAQQNIQALMDEYQTGIYVQSLSLTEAQLPPEIQSAIDDVTKAREDQERYISEAEAYENQIVPEARGQAAKLVEEAKGYRVQMVKKAEGEANRFEQLLKEYQRAPQVTRDRLYLETVQNVFQNSSKVMLDAEGGNNMMYLPLDQILSRQKSAAPVAQPQHESSAPRLGDTSSKVGSSRTRGAR